MQVRHLLLVVPSQRVEPVLFRQCKPRPRRVTTASVGPAVPARVRATPPLWPPCRKSQPNPAPSPQAPTLPSSPSPAAPMRLRPDSNV
eukprot:6185984-Pleurochrysis_carterae.AAC.1